MCSIFDNCEKAFVLTINKDTGEEYNYYIDSESAFSLARNTSGLVLIMIGNLRYRFVDGEPDLSIIDVDSTTIQQGEDYEGCIKG